MSIYAEFKKKSLENPKVKRYVMNFSQNMTRKQLSEANGITQANIKRIDNETRNPILEMLKRP